MSMQKPYLSFQKINFKALCLDVLKFFLAFLLFSILAAIMVWAHGFFVLESMKINVDEMSNFIVPDKDLADFDMKAYKHAFATAIDLSVIPASFYICFKDKPKTFIHIILLILILSFLMHTPFIYEDHKELFNDNLLLFTSFLFGWMCSLIWFRYRAEKRP